MLFIKNSPGKAIISTTTKPLTQTATLCLVGTTVVRRDVQGVLDTQAHIRTTRLKTSALSFVSGFG
jgi:hypothetical protein